MIKRKREGPSRSETCGEVEVPARTENSVVICHSARTVGATLCVTCCPRAEGLQRPPLDWLCLFSSAYGQGTHRGKKMKQCGRGVGHRWGFASARMVRHRLWAERIRTIREIRCGSPATYAPEHKTRFQGCTAAVVELSHRACWNCDSPHAVDSPEFGCQRGNGCLLFTKWK